MLSRESASQPIFSSFPITNSVDTVEKLLKHWNHRTAVHQEDTTTTTHKPVFSAQKQGTTF